MIDLVQQCLDRDQMAWGDFYLMAERVGLRAIRRVLGKYRLAEQEYDVLQEVYLRLLKNDMRFLRSFHGTTIMQFQSWLARVAMRAACDWAKRELTKLQRQRLLTATHDVVENRGPTIDQLSGLLDDVAVMLRCDAKRLHVLIGLEPGNGIPNRTIRHWRHATPPLTG